MINKTITEHQTERWFIEIECGIDRNNNEYQEVRVFDREDDQHLVVDMKLHDFVDLAEATTTAIKEALSLAEVQEETE